MVPIARGHEVHPLMPSLRAHICHLTACLAVEHLILETGLNAPWIGSQGFRTADITLCHSGRRKRKEGEGEGNGVTYD